MTMHLQRDIESLRKKLLLLSAMVEDAISQAVNYLNTFDTRHAKQVEGLEDRVNAMEVEIEEDCLKILALHQPVAADLRFMIVALKVNNDLERMGDQAVNIASRVDALEPIEDLRQQLGLVDMCELVQSMLRNALDALVNGDAQVASEVVAMDDEVDRIHAENYDALRNFVSLDAGAIAPAMSYATISSNLERIGDLATNIAEEVIFMIDGQVVRHRDLHIKESNEDLD